MNKASSKANVSLLHTR